MSGEPNKTRHPSSLKTALLLAALSIFALASCLAGCQAAISSGAPPGTAPKAETLALGAWEWSPDVDCEPCHALEENALASCSCVQAQQETPACYLCHTDITQLEEAHTLPFPSSADNDSKSATVESETCIACHSISDLAPSTDAPPSFADIDAAVGDHHMVLDGKEGSHYSRIDCASCHNIHEPETLVEQSEGTCQTCHPGSFGECDTCH